jgi:CCR4-NOT transcription complex subunit 1
MLQNHHSPSATKAFCRILIQLLQQASTSLTTEDEAWSCFGGFLLEINPNSLPYFSLSWFEVVANKHFMPALLTLPKHWPLYAALLKAWFKFFSTCLAHSQPSPLIYNGTLRVLLVLLHDFPDFLSNFASDLCDSIPEKCIQFRNLVLSAFPRALKLPDPFSPHLKLDALCKASALDESALGVVGVEGIALHPASFEWKSNLPAVAQLLFNSPGEGESSDQDVKALAELLRQNLSQDANASIKCNALVLLIGSSAYSSLRIKVLSTLVTDSDPKLRYLLLSAIGNQLRFPSPQTLLYSKFLVSLFDECTPASPNHAVADQIVRVLLERLVVNRPHPWGLLVTFLELIKNPVHGFWARPFIKIAPEIERLFNSVARSCL